MILHPSNQPWLDIQSSILIPKGRPCPSSRFRNGKAHDFGTLGGERNSGKKCGSGPALIILYGQLAKMDLKVGCRPAARNLEHLTTSFKPFQAVPYIWNFGWVTWQLPLKTILHTFAINERKSLCGERGRSTEGNLKELLNFGLLILTHFFFQFGTKSGDDFGAVVKAYIGPSRRGYDVFSRP